jgi:hypothetical protein
MTRLIIKASESAATYMDTLSEDLLALDVDDVAPMGAGPAPAGSRSGAVEVVSTLVVLLTPGVPLLRAVVRVAEAWLKQVGESSLRLEIDGQHLEIRGRGGRAQERIVSSWIAAVQSRNAE